MLGLRNSTTKGGSFSHFPSPLKQKKEKLHYLEGKEEKQVGEKKRTRAE